MDINDIIQEESIGFLNELRTGSAEPFEFRKSGNNRYLIYIKVPQNNIDTTYDVIFSEGSVRGEKNYSLSFKETNGDYGSVTGFRVQFRILATVSKIVTVFVAEKNVDIINFSPVVNNDKINRVSGRKKNVDPKQRYRLYMEYVKDGAGEEFDAFVFQNGTKVNVEKRDPSFPIENGYQDQETIQDVMSQLSEEGGYYVTADLPENDPDYAKFEAASWSGLVMTDRSQKKMTGSARRFVDWMLNYDDLEYIAPNQERPVSTNNRNRQQQPDSGQVPIQRIHNPAQPQPQADAQIGSFQYFLQTEIWGNADFEALRPYFEAMKSIEDFNDLYDRVQMTIGNVGGNDRERLQEVMDAITNLKRRYQSYIDSHGSAAVNETLNEIEQNLNELLN